MMYSTLISLLLLFVTSQKDFTPEPLFNSSNTLYGNSSKVAREDGVISGNVAIRRASNGNIVIIVNRTSNAERTSPDGVPDLVFRFAPLNEDLSRYGYISFNLKQAQVFFQPGRLAVVTKNIRLAVSLSVEESEKTDLNLPMFSDPSRDLPNAVRLSQGIGLVRQISTISESSESVNAGKSPKAAASPALIDLEADFVSSLRRACVGRRRL